jgi:23S rRNA (cytidine1920-2'-O)/16S rRNA (cytidine1409-2'-O)-methyltransferase
VSARRRLDAELVRRGLVSSRSEASDAVAAQRVLVNGAIADKPARLVAAGDALILTGPPPRFVGRGGEKLDAALIHFDIDVAGRRVLDVGASTGGFTDCLLERGAEHVVALDVGHGQLHPRIRGDARVTVLERTNVRKAMPATIGGLVDAIVVDVSFISLRTIAPVLVTLCQPGSPMVLLVKPQFEAGRSEVDRGRGVIVDPAIHERVRAEVSAALAETGCSIIGWMDSPILGGHGNKEFLVHAVTAPDRTHP